MEPVDPDRVLKDVGAVADLSDESLWAEAVRGDADAFGEIYDRHIDRVYLQCLRRVGHREDAQDVAATVFAEAWRVRDRVRFVEGSSLPWLLVVASNLAGKHLRSARRYQRHLRLVRSPDNAADIADDVAETDELQRRARLLAAAITTLNRGEQQLVSLCDLGDLSYASAAQALEIPLGTVRSRLSRAHAKLRARLTDLTTTGQPADDSAESPIGGQHA